MSEGALEAADASDWSMEKARKRGPARKSGAPGKAGRVVKQIQQSKSRPQKRRQEEKGADAGVDVANEAKADSDGSSEDIPLRHLKGNGRGAGLAADVSKAGSAGRGRGRGRAGGPGRGRLGGRGKSGRSSQHAPKPQRGNRQGVDVFMPHPVSASSLPRTKQPQNRSRLEDKEKSVPGKPLKAASHDPFSGLADTSSPLKPAKAIEQGKRVASQGKAGLGNFHALEGTLNPVASPTTDSLEKIVAPIPEDQSAAPDIQQQHQQDAESQLPQKAEVLLVAQSTQAEGTAPSVDLSPKAKPESQLPLSAEEPHVLQPVPPKVHSPSQGTEPSPERLELTGGAVQRELAAMGDRSSAGEASQEAPEGTLQPQAQDADSVRAARGEELSTMEPEPALLEVPGQANLLQKEPEEEANREIPSQVAGQLERSKAQAAKKGKGKGKRGRPKTVSKTSAAELQEEPLLETQARPLKRGRKATERPVREPDNAQEDAQDPQVESPSAQPKRGRKTGKAAGRAGKAKHADQRMTAEKSLQHREMQEAQRPPDQELEHQQPSGPKLTAKQGQARRAAKRKASELQPLDHSNPGVRLRVSRTPLICKGFKSIHQACNHLPNKDHQVLGYHFGVRLHNH